METKQPIQKESKPNLHIKNGNIFSVTDIFDLSITDWKNKHRFSLHLVKKDENDQRWYSWAEYKTDKEGNFSILESPSLGGSYKGTDFKGLFWSLQPFSEANQPFILQIEMLSRKLETNHILIILEDEGRVVASKKLVYNRHRNPITEIRIDEKKTKGTLFLPQDRKSVV